MLINFRVENYLTFDLVSTFSMTLGKTKSHQKNILKNGTVDLLKFAAVYGANASGKSSFVSAIAFSQAMILNGINKEVISDLYNRNSIENEKRKSRFEYEIEINKNIYSYGFSMILSENKISEEWLYDITKDEIEIFVKSSEDSSISINFDYLNLDESDENRLRVYADDTVKRNEKLLITSLNNEKNELVSKDGKSIFTNLYEWFRHVLEVISPTEAANDFGLTYQNKKYLKKLSKYLKMNDTGIENVLLEESNGRMKDVPLDLENKLREKVLSDLQEENEKENDNKAGVLLKTPNSIYTFDLKDGKLKMYELKFEHGNDRIKYSLSEESDGTIRLIELFAVLFNKKEKVFVIDELDRSLHPLLTYNFIQSFLAKEDKNQLIVTTHEDRLLDLSLLRRDEIWFVKKDNLGNSSLYSLEEFKERFDKNIMNAYLDGRYGGTPKFSNLFSSLWENDEDEDGES